MIVIDRHYILITRMFNITMCAAEFQFMLMTQCHFKKLVYAARQGRAIRYR